MKIFEVEENWIFENIEETFENIKKDIEDIWKYWKIYSKTLENIEKTLKMLKKLKIFAPAQLQLKVLLPSLLLEPFRFVQVVFYLTSKSVGNAKIYHLHFQECYLLHEIDKE